MRVVRLYLEKKNDRIFFVYLFRCLGTMDILYVNDIVVCIYINKWMCVLDY